MLKQCWYFFVKTLFVIGILLGFFAFVEVFRIFTIFYRFNPLAGWIFVGIALLLLLSSIWYIRREWVVIPRALKPPPLPPLTDASHREMKRFCKYLIRYLDRLADNPQLSDHERDAAAERADYIDDALRAHPLNDDLRRTIALTDEETIRPLLESLEGNASREIRTCVRDVMLGVTLSPYHTVDLLVVIYRNATMVLRVARIFGGRPAPHEQFLILKDTLRVIATVNFIYMGRNLFENLFSSIPVVGRVIDDIGQGLGAGLFTSAAGHAAMLRCAAYQGWSQEKAAENMSAMTRTFLEDVRDIFIKDVFPEIKGRVKTSAPESATEDPGFWDSITKGISGAIDSTVKTVDNIVVAPAVSGTRSVLRAGASLTRGLMPTQPQVPRQPERRRVRKHSPNARPAPPGIKKIFRNLSQRIKYTGRS